MNVRLALTLGLAIVVSYASSARAHVRVFAQDGTEIAKACTYEKFVVRVPVEKTVPTVGLDVLVPPGVIVFATQPKAGWHADLQSVRGVVRHIRWSGGRLYPREFEEFAFLAATPRRPTTLDWDADQLYDDRSVVRWTGKPGSDTPHSQTTISDNAKGCAKK